MLMAKKQEHFSEVFKHFHPLNAIWSLYNKY